MDDPRFWHHSPTVASASTKPRRATCAGRLRTFLILFVPVLLLLGCRTANRLTVDRTTILPPLQTTQDIGHGGATTIHGTAIHLDAQQRLVLATARGYCAEPSPDAMSAYASSIGLGLRVSPTTAASAAEALQSYAGSIGLRTQSITLMRDALYRMCEASNNDHLADWEIAACLCLQGPGKIRVMG